MNTSILNDLFPDLPAGFIVPFVNDECGDTMWDAVLLEAEARDAVAEPANAGAENQ
ncbi:MAG: hypothetical protein JST86_10840 [Bacteroidetes bacterium]|nr:hypothetical protein [Bacteroidota bacterium]